MSTYASCPYASRLINMSTYAYVLLGSTSGSAGSTHDAEEIERLREKVRVNIVSCIEATIHRSD